MTRSRSQSPALAADESCYPQSSTPEADTSPHPQLPVRRPEETSDSGGPFETNEYGATIKFNAMYIPEARGQHWNKFQSSRYLLRGELVALFSQSWTFLLVLQSGSFKRMSCRRTPHRLQGSIAGVLFSAPFVI